MLGLGLSISSGSVSLEFSPEDISNLTIWLKSNENIISDQAKDGTSHSHSTAAGNMVNEDKISAWNAFGSTSINATQSTQADKPIWNTATEDIGGLDFTGGKYTDLSAQVDLAEDTDFTVAIRLKCTNYSAGRAFLGKAAGEFMRFSNNTTIRLKLNNTNRDFALSSGTFATDKYITLIIVRSDGDTSNINIYARGVDSGYFDGTATGTQVGSQLQDNAEVTITDLGTAVDDTQNFFGIIKDCIVYNGTAVSASQREALFDYIEGN
tara:strand:- start:3902 stop:4699 length:798 start_codon:yes stop_codon:yes gene_type:complete